LCLEARIEFRGIGDEGKFQILTLIVAAQRPISAGVERINLYGDADLGQVCLNDLGSGLGSRVIEASKRYAKIALSCFGQQRLGLFGVVRIDGSCSPMAQELRGKKRLCPSNGSRICTGNNRVNINSEADRLPNLDIVQGGLFDIDADQV